MKRLTAFYSILFLIYLASTCLDNVDALQRKKRQRQIEYPSDDQICLTPNQRLGTCITFVRCQVLQAANDLKILRESHCGFEDRMPKVCCPKMSQVGEIELIESTTQSNNFRPKTTRRINRKTTIQTLDPDIIVPYPSDVPPILPEREQEEFFKKPRRLPLVCGNTTVQSTRIVGGAPSLPGAWPWMASLFIEQNGVLSPQCGGALISEDTVLTAAHCVIDDGKVKAPSQIIVRLGEHNINIKAPEDAEKDFQVAKVIPHEQFQTRTFKNDIALLKLAERVKFNKRIWPVCLAYDSPLLRSKSTVGRAGIISGWGRLAFDGRASDVLQEAQVDIVSQEQCYKAYEQWVSINDFYLCAGVSGSVKDSCQGDSGGPLVQIDPANHLYYQTGIVSFGRKCATAGFPGVYTRVSEYLKWIGTHI